MQPPHGYSHSPAPPAQRSLGGAIAIGAGWGVLGVGASLLGVGIVMIGLNGFMSIGLLTKVMWFVASPVVTIFGGVPGAVAYRQGAPSGQVAAKLGVAALVAVACWVSVFFVAPL